MLNTIDLFAGAGGLSLGFLQSGAYDIKVAFENNPSMQDTYRKNHPGVDVLGDVCGADYRAIKKKYGSIDVIIGGPPCQGFSNANRQKNHAVSQNNMLVKQYIRAVRELRPRAFVMENVSMLGSDTHRFFYNENDIEDVQKYKIPTVNSKLVLLEKEFMFANAIAVVRNWEEVAKELWPEELYCAVNVVYKASDKAEKTKKALEKHRRTLVNLIQLRERNESIAIEHIHGQSVMAFNSIKEYYEGKIDEKTVKQRIEHAVMLQRMLGKLKEIHDNRIIVDSVDDEGNLVANIKTYAVLDYLKSILESGDDGYLIDAKVLCAADFGAPQKRERFVIMGVKKSLRREVKLPKGTFCEKDYRTVRDAIGDLEKVQTVVRLDEDKGTRLRKIIPRTPLEKELRDSKVLYNHIVTDTGKDAMARFRALKQGENFHALDEALKTNTYSDVSRTQNTIYLRLDYNQPCGTVVNVRKSMWVHPTLDRAISIREAARLQTFPDSFVFCGTKDKQYQQVGNAVPPLLARAIAEQLAHILCDEKQKNEETKKV
jgi:DNA (cytosine-5)-methyltransferase 1